MSGESGLVPKIVGEVGTVLAIGGFAGFINYLQRFNGDPPPRWSWLVVFVKVMTAGFVGLLTHWLFAKWDWSTDYVYFAVAVSGYGGAETIALFQQIWRNAVYRASGAATDSPPKV